MSSGKVQNEGADIVYHAEGTGPVLVTIAGRGGLGSRFAGLSAILQGEYTVVRYDRRGCGDSSGDARRPMDLLQHARDAIAVVKHLGVEQAYVFGQSAGAAIAVRLAEFYPEFVTGLVLHEPMIPSILPDAAAQIAFTMNVDEIYRSQGVGPAMKLLATSMVGFSGAAGPPAQPPREGAGIDPFLENEIMSVCYYHPDLARIRRSAIPVVAAKGRMSEDAYYARTADVLGERLGCPVATMSGNHVAFASDPAIFAAELRPLLHGEPVSQAG